MYARLLAIGMAIVVMTTATRTVSAEILYEEHFETPVSHENFLETYSDLQILNELELFPGFSLPSGAPEHEVIDGALKYGVGKHPAAASGLGWAELGTIEKFKPSAEGNKIRFTARIKSKGNPGNYSVGITAWDLQFDVAPGFNFNSFLCAKHNPNVDLEDCAGGVFMNLRERQRSRSADRHIDTMTQVFVEQGEWFTMMIEWDGGQIWDLTLEGTGETYLQQRDKETWTVRYNRQEDDPFGLLPVPGDDGIRFGVSAQQNPLNPDPRGYCGVGGNFEWLPSFGYGYGICDNWIDFMMVEEIPALVLGDVNGDGLVNNLDITAFIAALAADDEAAFLVAFPEGSYIAADIDLSGLPPNNLDITPFITLLAEGSASVAVPEPGSIAFVVAILATVGCRRRRSR